MRFALIDNKKVEAAPGLKALCPGCNQPVIPKCGTKKVHHWAHCSNVMCDNWWEPETAWHRSWKNIFPFEYQEIFLTDERTGEKHIADVCNKHGMVIEFQHSHITPQERNSREIFYKNMIWVIDGTRLKRDYPRFVKGMNDCFRSTGTQGFYFVHFLDECFPFSWINSKVPVIFDFQLDNLSNDPIDAMREHLWCLLPQYSYRYSVIAILSRNDFIKIITDEPKFLLCQKTPGEIVYHFENNLRKREHSSQMQNIMNTAQRKEMWRSRFRRF